MKTAIVYYSKHHENTKKILDAIAEKNEVTLINILENPVCDLSEYDCIGFASGIYYSKFHKPFAVNHLSSLQSFLYNSIVTEGCVLA